MESTGRAAPLLALPAAAALAVDPGGLAPFGPAKGLVVPALVLAGTAAVAAGRAVVVVRRPTLAWGPFLLVVAAAAALADDPVYAWTGTPERRFGALAWLLCALAFVGGQALGARRAAVAAAVAAAAVGVWAAAEVLGWEPIALTGVGDRPVGPLGSSAYLGAAACLLGPAAAGLAVRGRAAWWGAAAVAGVALVASGARAAWVGALVAALVVGASRRAPPSPPKVRQLRTFSVLNWRTFAVVGAVVGALVGLAFATGVAGRVPAAFTDDGGGVRGRLDEWRVAARVIAEDPLLGTGPEGYRLAFGATVDDRYEMAHGRDPLPDRAHSAPLDVAATTGLPGALAYLVVVGAAGVLVVRAARRAEPAVAGAAAGVLAYAVQSLFLFPVAELDPVAWLLAGAVAAAVARPGEVARVRVPMAVPAVAGVLAVAAVAAGVLDLAADRAARSELAAAADPGRAARLRPDAVRYRLVAARSLEALGTPAALDAAVRHLDRALAVSPRDPVARGERARLLLDRARLTDDPADAAAARRAFDELLAGDPRNAEVLLRAGLARALAGDRAGAERAWLAAERLAPRSAAPSTNLAVAYAQAGRWDEARAAARRALARDPGATRARDVLRLADGT